MRRFYAFGRRQQLRPIHQAWGPQHGRHGRDHGQQMTGGEGQWLVRGHKQQGRCDHTVLAETCDEWRGKLVSSSRRTIRCALDDRHRQGYIG